jgi:plasmid stabilization system protein ParE
VREIIWATNGKNSFKELLGYIKECSGPINAGKIYDKIISEIELLRSERVTTRKTQELVKVGVNDIYELLIKPWKIYYKILNENKTISIQFIIDGRRNIEEVLLNLVMENKL